MPRARSARAERPRSVSPNLVTITQFRRVWVISLCHRLYQLCRVIHIQLVKETDCQSYVALSDCQGMQQNPQSLVDNPPLATTFSATAFQQPTSGLDRNGRNPPSRAHEPGVSKLIALPDVDAVDFHILYRETASALDAYGRLVCEGKFIECAHAFSRYVLNAGIPRVLKRHAAEGTLKVDGAFLEWRVQELTRQVQSQYVTGVVPGVPESELASINHKLNLIAGRLAQLSVLSQPKE